jgi:hypothetical protein
MVTFVAVMLAAVWIFTALLGLGLFMAAARGDRQLALAGLGTTPPVARSSAGEAASRPPIRAVA